MARIVRSSESIVDLAEIVCYIAEHNATAAEKWIDGVDRLLKLIARNPGMGEAVDHLMPGLRRFTHGRYLLFFKPQPNGILLYRVLDGARRMEDLFD